MLDFDEEEDEEGAFESAPPEVGAVDIKTEIFGASITTSPREEEEEEEDGEDGEDGEDDTFHPPERGPAARPPLPGEN